MNRTIAYIKNLNILDDEYVVLACSYGPDSMALLDILNSFNLKIIVAHVNHKIRPESDEEYSLLEHFCKQNNFVFEATVIDKYEKSNFESEAREKRYNFFESVLKKYNSKYLFTAHHGDDLTETIIMRLIRGSSLKGYSGFQIISNRKSYKLIRPLIFYSKNELMGYVKKNKIPYSDDVSNFSDVYTRNKIRQYVMPFLKEINPNVNKKFLKFSEIIIEYYDYFDQEANNIYRKIYKNNCLDLNEFIKLPDLIKRIVLEKILLSLYQDQIIEISDKHLDLILKLSQNQSTNKILDLPNGRTVIKFYNILEFLVQNIKTTEYNYVFDQKINLPTGIIEQVKETDIIISNYLLRLNSAEICLPLHIRTRKVGDKMAVKNLGGNKKVSDILTDSKVKINIKNILPVVEDSKGKILWIPGVKKSIFDKQKDESYDIILKYIQKGEEDEK